ncbi:DUF397 domain-containing protein [Streptomyces sediminimaris]|uniref:DUF397 domain-containing protein n=1 Tax=Streptomyces sediminimaris TaxID=3383721 RepID=UPI00399AA9E9
MSTVLQWIKSSHSSNEGGNCVEVATQPSSVHIRDSKNAPAGGGIVTVSPAAWTAFLGTGGQTPGEGNRTRR